MLLHKPQIQGLACIIVLLLLAVVAAGDTHSDFDRTFNFATLHTWEFAPVAMRVRDPMGYNPLWEDRLRQEFTLGFESRNYVRSASAPDFKVRFRLGTRERERVDYFPDLFPGFRDYRAGWIYWNAPWAGSSVFRIPYTEATLVCDIVSTRTERLVWRGYDRRTIDMDRSEKTLRKAVGKLLDRFVSDSKKAQRNFAP